MLRNVPHLKSILACGMGGLILAVVMLTWIYPTYLNEVSQAKETKVRELVQDRYGISGRSATLYSKPRAELSKIDAPNTGATASTSTDGTDDAAKDTGEDDSASHDTTPLPPAKRD